MAGRPGDHQVQPDGPGSSCERVQQSADALVRPQLPEAHEDTVGGGEPEGAARVRRRQLVRIAADVVAVGHDGGGPSASAAVAARAASACTTSRAERTRSQRSAPVDDMALVRQGVVHRPHDAIAKEAGEQQRGDEGGHAARGRAGPRAVVELRPVEVEDLDLARVAQQPPGRQLGARRDRDAARGEGLR